MARAVLITGGNIGDVEQTLVRASSLLEERLGEIIKVSAVYRSAPWGEFGDGDDTHVGDFMNQVVVVETDLSPSGLLEAIQNIECELGRHRPDSGPDKREGDLGTISGPARRYTSRTIDIDILFYDDLLICSPELTIPHPAIESREFVLRPLAEVMPAYEHPRSGRTITELLDEIKSGEK